MVWGKKIQGSFVYLRAVEIVDAEFIVNIRNDKSLNKFIHETPKDIEKQKKWIQEQRESLNDFYFIIYNNTYERIGLASIYNIDLSEKIAEFGRWISYGNAFENLETVILLFDFAFEEFEIDSIYTRTMQENKKVINLWKRFGGKNMGEIYEMDMLLNKNIVTKEDYNNELRIKNLELLNFCP